MAEFTISIPDECRGHELRLKAARDNDFQVQGILRPWEKPGNMCQVCRWLTTSGGSPWTRSGRGARPHCHASKARSRVVRQTGPHPPTALRIAPDGGHAIKLGGDTGEW